MRDLQTTEPEEMNERPKVALPLAPTAPARVRRRLPLVPRALAARPPRGRGALNAGSLNRA